MILKKLSCQNGPASRHKLGQGNGKAQTQRACRRRRRGFDTEVTEVTDQERNTQRGSGRSRRPDKRLRFGWARGKEGKEIPESTADQLPTPYLYFLVLTDSDRLGKYHKVTSSSYFALKYITKTSALCTSHRNKMSPSTATWWQGGYKRHDHLSPKNLFNAFLFLVAPVPSIVFTLELYSSCMGKHHIWDTSR